MNNERPGGPAPPDFSAKTVAVSNRAFALLQDLTTTILEAATVLTATLEGRTPPHTAWQTVRDLEHKGDAIARDLYDFLIAHGTAVGERDALKALAGYLDDILDLIEAVAARLAIHRIRRVPPVVREMGGIVLECAGELNKAIGRSRMMREVFPHTRNLNRLENTADDVLHRAIEVLFSRAGSTKDLASIMKWQDICEMLEDATDRCEDIANVMETLMIQAGAEDQLEAGRLVMDVARHEVTVDGVAVSLTAKEYDLLHILLRHHGKVVRRERLLGEVWGGDYYGDARTLDTHVAWLRKKVEAGGGVRIITVRGIGYRLDLGA
jgi:uncharacterized protein Yka (UPF0111/DUF47 family)